MAARKRTTPKTAGGLKVPQLKYTGDVPFEAVTAPEITTPEFDFTDPNVNYDQIFADEISAGQVRDPNRITAGTVGADTLADRFMTSADYAMVDPSDISRQIGEVTRSEMAKNAELSSKLALDSLETELKGLQNYVPAASVLKRGEIAKDNLFNQAERDAQLERADPNLRGDLEGQRRRANAYAEGRVPDSIQDRALELGIRSGAADAAASGGFGVRSGAARKASELMSAAKRIELSQYGDQALTSNMKNRSDYLLAPTQYSDAGSQVKVTPTTDAGTASRQIASEANRSIVTGDTALTTKVNENQFASNLEQEARKTNVTLAAEKDFNQANLNLNAATTNVGNQLTADMQNETNAINVATGNADRTLRADEVNVGNRLTADQTNVSNAMRASEFGKTLSSNEKQSVAQMQWNTSNSNAQRVLEASTVNSQGKFSAAAADREMKQDIQKTNKTFIFQDRQARQAEAAANARAAAAEAGASARAAMSASAQRESLAAAAAQREQDRQWALADRAEATRLYYENRDRGENNASSAAAGTAIARLPSYVSGISASIGAISSIADAFGYGSDSSSDFDSGSNDFNFDFSSGNSDYNNEPDFSTPDFSR